MDALSPEIIRKWCRTVAVNIFVPYPSHYAPVNAEFDWLIENKYVEENAENEYVLTKKGNAARFDSEYIIRQAKDIFAEWGIPVDDYEWEHEVHFVTHVVYGTYKKNGSQITLADIYVRDENSEILQSMVVLG